MNILIVDDDSGDQTITRSMLECLGIKSKACLNPLDAEQMMTSEHYDAVLIDYNLPQMNGIDLAKILKEKFPVGGKIILISGFLSENVSKRVNDSRNLFDGVIDKNKLLAGLKKMANHA